METRINLAEAFDAWRVLTPADPAPTEAELAVCPAARSAMVYVLDESRRGELVPRAVEVLEELDGVDLVISRERGARRCTPIAGASGSARRGSSPTGAARTGRCSGELAALRLEAEGGTVTSSEYPDALGRLWSALECPHAGDVLVSASPSFEFMDWGGSDHVGGGSHGSLHRDDSEGVLLLCGVDAPARDDQWSLADVTPLVLDHFRVR